MKQILTASLLVLLFGACDMRDTTMKNRDIAKELPYVWSDGQLIEGFTVYTIDSCEYIGHGIGAQCGILARKGNCKFCAARK